MKSALLLLVAACVDTGPGPTPGKKIDATYVQAHLLSAVPADIERFDLTLAGGVTYLGNKVDKTRVPPGQPVTITHYWRVDAPIGDHWRAFAQLRGAPSSADFMNLQPTDMQAGHGPSTWQVGEIIEDIQVINLRPDWRSHEATLLVGLIEIGKHNTLDRMRAEGPRTLDNAIIANKFEVDLARAPAPKGSLYVQNAAGSITVDGLANDPGWQGIPMAELVTAEGASGEPLGKATAKMTWNAEFLYVFVSVTDSDITSPYKNQDDPLWKADCVELFIDADSNKQGYVELQVNPNNATFDSWFQTTRAKPGDVEWDSGMVTAVKLRGSTDAGDSGDLGWDVEIAIPWDAVKGREENMKVRLPPEVGDRWRLNLVRVDVKTGAKNNEMFASSWNRITMADFHALDRMLTVVFADRAASIIPQAKDPNGQGSARGAGSGSSRDPQPPNAPSTGSGSGQQPQNAGSGNAKRTGSGSAQVESAPVGTSVGSGSGSSTTGAGSGSATKANAPRAPAPTELKTVSGSGSAAQPNPPEASPDRKTFSGSGSAATKR